ncbi:hypothetical protein [Rhizohabitans arisaemae]|uniref:hypothetical protein n=1 Tax=Rhizohabitans arisaemae TaxID=2720610 RepID=UPI0024B092AE|nr:hypothetical protein [Rhizohabitans arisaemae]
MKGFLTLFAIVVVAFLGVVAVQNGLISLPSPGQGSDGSGRGEPPPQPPRRPEKTPSPTTEPPPPVQKPKTPQGPPRLGHCLNPSPTISCQIDGAGFEPEETVDLFYTYPSSAEARYEVVASDEGAFAYAVLRADVPGTVRVRAVGRSSGRTAEISFVTSD